MSITEIAKLETRWRENPHGLTFAPLAEAYRKQHEPKRALEVLAEGLARHPDYIPASIVLGRCHLDLADDARAEAAFQRVLELDDENVIALKALADISERQGRPADAAGRLRALLSVDRSNDEARAQLARVEAAANAPAPAPSAPAVEEPVADAPTPAEAATESEALSPADYVWDEPVEVEAPTDAGLLLEDHLRPVGEVAPLEDIVLEEPPAIHGDAAGTEAMPGLVGEDFPQHRAGVVPMADLAPGTAAIGEHAFFRDMDDVREPETAHRETAEGRPSELEDVAPEVASLEPIGELERSAEIELTPAGASEFQVESVSDEWAAGGPGTDRDHGLDDLERAESSYELSSSAADDRLGDDGLTVPVSEPGDELAVADSDADVFAETVEPDEAEPVAEPASEPETPEPAPAFAAHAPSEFGRRASDADDDADDEPAAPPLPDDLVVTESMAELFLRQGHRAEALLVYRELYHRNRDDLRLREKVDALETELAAEVAASPRGRSYAALDRGRSVATFLSGVFAARPADAPSAWVAAPAPPAAAPAASEAASESGDAAPTRPASDHLSLSDVFGDTGSPVPPAVAATAGAPAADDDGMSFDAFFGEAAGAATRPRGSAREDEDLDQFHAWLQNLKR
jgi:tetratricopeptide (TPR) repeat protein